jgi:hypothetical protein
VLTFGLTWLAVAFGLLSHGSTYHRLRVHAETCGQDGKPD